MNSIAEISERVRSQNNHGTADVIFMVKLKMRHIGMDPVFDGPIVWLDEQNELVEDEELIKKLNAIEDDGLEDPDFDFDQYTKTSYFEDWKILQCFFTEASAKQFIEDNKHRYPADAVFYVDADSTHRNPEMKAIRDLLVSNKLARLEAACQLALRNAQSQQYMLPKRFDPTQSQALDTFVQILEAALKP